MPITVVPHLNFRSEARQALTFYHSVFGGDLTVVTYGDAHDESAPADHVIFGQVSAPSGFTIMAYDVQTERSFDRGERPSYIAVRCTTEEELRSGWDGLSEEASIFTPLGPSPFSPLYGMLTDRFGIIWFFGLDA